MRGAGSRTTTRQPISVVLLSWGAAAIGILLIAIPSLYVDLPVSTRLFLIGSFGASAALLYGAPHSDFAQPRNLIIGQLVAASVGVTAYKAIGAHVGLAGAVPAATTIATLQVAHCLHPPAGGYLAHCRTRPRTSSSSRLCVRSHDRSEGIHDSARCCRDCEQPLQALRSPLPNHVVVMD